MKESEKKEWKTPEFMALIRNVGDESVLSYCKQEGGGTPAGPGWGNGICGYVVVPYCYSGSCAITDIS